MYENQFLEVPNMSENMCYSLIRFEQVWNMFTGYRYHVY